MSFSVDCIKSDAIESFRVITQIQDSNINLMWSDKTVLLHLLLVFLATELSFSLYDHTAISIIVDFFQFYDRS